MFPLGRRAAAAEALVIWCPTFESSRPHGTERVARILAPALIEWLDREHTLTVYPLPELDAVLA